MKLVVAGSTGFVATEIIAQALSHPAITSVIALGRRSPPTPHHLGPSASNLKFVLLSDFDQEYPDDVKRELAGADAVIWTIEVSAPQSKSTPSEEILKVCRDFPIRALRTIAKVPRPGTQQPTRFLYLSSHMAKQDPNNKPLVPGEYARLRGESETGILEAGKQTNAAVHVAITKPGLIVGPDHLLLTLQPGILGLAGVPSIRLSEVAAALLDQVVSGFDKDTLVNEDLVRIGQAALAAQK
ncbi:hypothetical protein NEMBOFW57_003525 [Staphylotrichum longicolle]|uniref:NAD-dependent epimerase/dehydratase domain-containing protein n=1 Tax=Staphylotrichum longicolle TaxID=669026 RepID=A0AAD4F5F3_9PEZI|nr:hypothetical protein NEMBOFW57_003525 [Staphylotrichum longicolle]